MGSTDVDNQVPQVITVLGSTGSVGVNTLAVVARYPDRFALFALTADTNVQRLASQCLEFQPVYAVMRNEQAAAALRGKLSTAGCRTEVLAGTDALCEVSRSSTVHTVVAAIVGGAGLLPTMAAVQAGKKVLLANKETLVMAGGLVMEAARIHGAVLLPIDSEHNAIFQCLPGNYTVGEHPVGVRKIVLTGSGGPFRGWSATAIAKATPEQACNHPNWSMGRKISVDSATLMNKGLEYIEARWLFDLQPKDIEIVIHPQSIIHSMVEYVDGSVLAQLGHPDMRTPIAHALAWPERMDSGVGALDLITAQDLQFETPDFERFPALSLAIDSAFRSMGAAAILNAANEVAVAAFLRGQLSFYAISDVLAEVMDTIEYREPHSIEAVLQLDCYARELASGLSQGRASLQ